MPGTEALIFGAFVRYGGHLSLSAIGNTGNARRSVSNPQWSDLLAGASDDE